MLLAFCNNSPLTSQRLQSFGTNAVDHQSNAYQVSESIHQQSTCNIGVRLEETYTQTRLSTMSSMRV